LWKTFAILLEDYDKENYVLAITQVEHESQRALDKVLKLAHVIY
jgi:hypothetical protein